MAQVKFLIMPVFSRGHSVVENRSGTGKRSVCSNSTGETCIDLQGVRGL
jgi:hypothetical protein